MRHLEIYENFGSNGSYYRIKIDKSFENFEIALYKLGILEEFLEDWQIEDWNDVFPENQSIFKNNEYVNLVIYDYPSNYMQNKFFVYNDESFTFMKMKNSFEYKGDINLSEEEREMIKNIIKYNL